MSAIAEVINEKVEMKEILTQIIKEYRWLKNEMERLEVMVLGGYAKAISWGVAQYGIEATLPKGSSGMCVQTIDKLERREQRRYRRLQRLDAEIYIVEYIETILETETEQTVYDMWLEGYPTREIASHIDVHRDTINDVKNAILKKALADELVETFLLYGVVDKSVNSVKSAKTI